MGSHAGPTGPLPRERTAVPSPVTCLSPSSGKGCPAPIPQNTFLDMSSETVSLVKLIRLQYCACLCMQPHPTPTLCPVALVFIATLWPQFEKEKPGGVFWLQRFASGGADFTVNMAEVSEGF